MNPTQMENTVLDLLDRIVGDFPSVTVGEMEIRDDSDTLPNLLMDMRRYFEADAYNRREVGRFVNRLSAHLSSVPVRYHYPVIVGDTGRCTMAVSVEVEDA